MPLFLTRSRNSTCTSWPRVEVYEPSCSTECCEFRLFGSELWLGSLEAKKIGQFCERVIRALVT